ncbi:DUF6351 family protein, partial [Streptomyces niveus]
MSRRPVLAIALATGALLLTCLPSAAAERPGGDKEGGGGARLTIDTLSTRPDVVTGGDVLVRVGVPRGVDPDHVRVT